MNPVPTSVGAASLPQVNLLPAEVGQRRARGRARLAVMGVALLLLAALGALVYLTYAQKQTAETEVADLALRNTELQAQQASLAYVTEARQRKDLALDARRYVGLHEVQVAPLLVDIREVLPKYTYLWNVAWEKTNVDAPAAPEASAFAMDDMGLLMITLRSDYFIDAASVSDGLDSLPQLARTEVTSVEFVEDQTGTLTPDAYYIAWDQELDERGVEDVELPAGTELISGGDVYYEMILFTRIEFDALSLRFSDKWYEGLEAQAQAQIPVYAKAVADDKEFRDAVIARARDLGTPDAVDVVSPTPTPEETN